MITYRVRRDVSPQQLQRLVDYFLTNPGNLVMTDEREVTCVNSGDLLREARRSPHLFVQTSSGSRLDFDEFGEHVHVLLEPGKALPEPIIRLGVIEPEDVMYDPSRSKQRRSILDSLMNALLGSPTSSGSIKNTGGRISYAATDAVLEDTTLTLRISLNTLDQLARKYTVMNPFMLYYHFWTSINRSSLTLCDGSTIRCQWDPDVADLLLSGTVRNKQATRPLPRHRHRLQTQDHRVALVLVAIPNTSPEVGLVYSCAVLNSEDIQTPNGPATILFAERPLEDNSSTSEGWLLHYRPHPNVEGWKLCYGIYMPLSDPSQGDGEALRDLSRGWIIT